MNEKSNVLLSRKLWERAQSKDELKLSIARYMKISYPNYKIEKVVRDGEFYIAICVKE